jgi:hypothetical protein
MSLSAIPPSLGLQALFLDDRLESWQYYLATSHLEANEESGGAEPF